jgi:hypothetical protein
VDDVVELVVGVEGVWLATALTLALALTLAPVLVLVLVLVEEDDGGTEELEVACTVGEVVVVPATEDLLALYL